MGTTGLRHVRLRISGHEVDGSSRYEVRDPTYNQARAEVEVAGPREVELALAAAQAASRDLARWPSHEKAAVLERAAALIEGRSEELARLVTQETGKALRHSRVEAARAVETFRISAEEAKRVTGEQVPIDAAPGGEGRLAFLLRMPLGPVAAITPFNAPLNLVSHKVAPAFAAGDPLVIKPSSAAPSVAEAIVAICMESGFPAGSINLIFGPGQILGPQMVADARVRLVTFTGGRDAARDIISRAGIKKVMLELGGNGGAIVHRDCDVHAAARSCARGAFSNSGQSCISLQRIYCDRVVLETFLDELCRTTAKLQVGDPLDPATDIGPLVNEAAALRVESWIDEAVAQGGKLISAYRRDGPTIWPTIVLNPPPSSRLMCNEVFGPVVSIVPYHDVDDALQAVNDTTYGLQAGIFTSNIDLAWKAAHVLDVGAVNINGSSSFRVDLMPYGGTKDSGLGREGPRYAIRELTEPRLVIFHSTGEAANRLPRPSAV